MRTQLKQHHENKHNIELDYIKENETHEIDLFLGREFESELSQDDKDRFMNGEKVVQSLNERGFFKQKN